MIDVRVFKWVGILAADEVTPAARNKAISWFRATTGDYAERSATAMLANRVSTH